MQDAHHILHLILKTLLPSIRRSGQCYGGAWELNSVPLNFIPVCYITLRSWELL